MVLISFLHGEKCMGLERWQLAEALAKANTWCNDLLKFANIRDADTYSLLYECDIHGAHKIEKAPLSDRHRKVLSVTDES